MHQQQTPDNWQYMYVTESGKMCINKYIFVFWSEPLKLWMKWPHTPFHGSDARLTPTKWILISQCLIMKEKIKISKPATSLILQILPAVVIALKHDFWSIRLQMTYLAWGRNWRNANMHNTRAMPVAVGTTKHEATEVAPAKHHTTQNHLYLQ